MRHRQCQWGVTNRIAEGKSRCDAAVRARTFRLARQNSIQYAQPFRSNEGSIVRRRPYNKIQVTLMNCHEEFPGPEGNCKRRGGYWISSVKKRFQANCSPRDWREVRFPPTRLCATPSKWAQRCTRSIRGEWYTARYPPLCIALGAGGARNLKATTSPEDRAAYRAPEQIRGEEPDVLSDVFAYGALVYEIATGTARSAERARN